MTSVRLDGPFPLDASRIDSHVRRSAPGVFAIRRGSGRWRIGSADTDLATRLKEEVGAFTEFKFAYAHTAYAAFEMACTLYHELDDPRGTRVRHGFHPSRPGYSEWRRPLCRQFD